jgi:hypothetical protein
MGGKQMWVKVSAMGALAILVLSGCSGQSQAYEPIQNACKELVGLELQRGPDQGERVVRLIRPELQAAEEASKQEAAAFMLLLEDFEQLNADKSEHFQQVRFLLVDIGGYSLDEAQAFVDEREPQIADVSRDEGEIENLFAERGDRIEDSFETLCESYAP